MPPKISVRTRRVWAIFGGILCRSSYHMMIDIRRPLDGRLCGGGGGVALGEIEDLDEGRRRLGAGNRVLTVDDKAGNAVDAQPTGIDVGRNDLLAAFVALQVFVGKLLVEAGAPRAVSQDF